MNQTLFVTRFVANFFIIMVLSKIQKIEQANLVSQRLKSAASTVFVSFRGLKISQMTELRRQLHEFEIDAEVVKTKVLSRAMIQAGFEVPESLLGQPVAVVSTFADELEPFKKLVNFAKENDKLVVLAGIFEQELVDSAIAVSIAGLPGRAQLQGQLVGLLASLPARLVYAVRYNGSALTSVLKQYLQSKN